MRWEGRSGTAQGPTVIDDSLQVQAAHAKVSELGTVVSGEPLAVSPVDRAARNVIKTRY